jgi:hypothetical protein
MNKARRGLSKPAIFVLLAATSLVLVTAGYAYLKSRDREQVAEAASVPQNEVRPNDASSEQSPLPSIGGIRRPATDVQIRPLEQSGKPKQVLKIEGPNPSLKGLENPDVEQVAKSLSKKGDSSLLSTQTIPRDFDASRFAAEGEIYSLEYAKTIATGRVFSSAQPDSDTIPIRSQGSRLFRLQQGESSKLIVQTLPFAPVTFTSFRLGQFENKLSTITVVADKDGVAQAVFTATTGSILEIPVLAASPVNSGQVRFVVSVKPPITDPVVAKDGSTRP